MVAHTCDPSAQEDEVGTILDHRVRLSQNKNKNRAQSGKCLPCKHEDLNSDPQHPCSKTRWNSLYVCSPSTQEVKTETGGSLGLSGQSG